MKTLKVFFEEPLTEHYFREIIRKSKTPPITAQKEIKELMKNNEITKTRKAGNIIFYKLNRDNEDVIKKKRIHNLQTLYDSKLIEQITKDYSPTATILFGSYEQGYDTENSDIDIVIFVTKKTNEKDYDSYEKLLKRHINLHVLNNLKEVPKELRNNILNGTVLNGYLRVF